MYASAKEKRAYTKRPQQTVTAQQHFKKCPKEKKMDGDQALSKALSVLFLNVSNCCECIRSI
jgi:hypothetical protein